MENQQDKVSLMSINATKAGMEGLDKSAINAIIEEASKGSKFYEAKAKAQKRIDAKKEIMRHRLKSLGQEIIESANIKADKIIEDIQRTESDTSHVIVHVDMDAFYAAVEERDDPSLKTGPMAVGSMGMLSTSNYLARKFGVRAGMPGFIGKKLCPNLKIVPTNFDKYRAVSAQVRQVFQEYDANFCPMSLDEAYLDLTDYLLTHPSRTPGEVVHEMRQKIEERTTLTASAGISFNTMLAKISSDQNKPNGQHEILDESKAKEFVSTLPVRKVGGIGNVTEQLLQVLGVEKCQDILEHRGSILLLFSELSAVSFFRIALGIGSIDIADMAHRERKSMSTETTFKDTSDPQKLREICSDLCAELASDLQGESLQGRQVTVKIKTHKFAIKTKVSNLLQPTAKSEIICQTAFKILHSLMELCEEKPLTLRLLGVRMSELSDSAATEHSSEVEQKSITNFFQPQSKMTEFECPLCSRIIPARNEAAFYSTHFETCSTSSCQDPEASDADASACVKRDHDDEPCWKVGDFPAQEGGARSSFPIQSSAATTTLAADSTKVFSSPRGGIEEETSVQVSCPICQETQASETINSHIDLCLNKQTIDQLSNNKRKNNSPSKSVHPSKKSKASIKSYFAASTSNCDTT